MKVSAREITRSRRHLIENVDSPIDRMLAEEAAEGGCGVTGFACNIPVCGRHIIEPSIQMHNRGNGKGGGIAAVGFDPDQLGVSREVLDNDFLLQIALLDESALKEVEENFVHSQFHVDHEAFVDTVDDYTEIPGLEVKPPAVKRYFVRAKPEVLDNFRKERGLEDLSLGKAEEEFVYQNSYQLNMKYYSSLGEKRAFVLSHGRNMMILKIVGYAEEAARYYKLEDFKAHVWIAHQRYPTKGRVWHPGGAHPFIGMDEALVHNGDFANYYSVSEYLKQRNVHPLFLTDTEVSILVFDLLNRVYEYPLEYIIESLAPTSENDFDHLSEEKQRIYAQIQATQIHGSPDGPWFFIIARNMAGQDQFQLIGITDTAMLRPQVFAIQKGEVEIGLVCSEKQAIDATLESLAKEDPRFGAVADRYWNARGGSYTDGGAFIFNVGKSVSGKRKLVCVDKFGNEIDVPPGQEPFDNRYTTIITIGSELKAVIDEGLKSGDVQKVFLAAADEIANGDFDRVTSLLEHLAESAGNEDLKETAIDVLTLLLDRRYPTAKMRRRSILQMISETLCKLFRDAPLLNGRSESRYARIDFERREAVRPPEANEEVLIIDAYDFPPEGDDCDARLICDAYDMGWKRFIGLGYKGQRFLGCGLGPNTKGVRIDAYGSAGDYLGSGMDGLELRVHGNAQDQLGQILKRGKLVIYGDVGQTFMYGAKGGEVYVLGNAAGRPLINAVGRPRVVINGTALDFLAESFMAGDAYNGGGFVIVNGLAFNDVGKIVDLTTPYFGANLFSLASGGAIFVRDPHHKIVPEQLNGGEIVDFTNRDWELILPYLEENERLFGISINDDLLTIDDKKCPPSKVYRTVRPVKLSVLAGDPEEE
ncbi:glutamate synthase [Candidatus Hydrogenedentota bacterium]